MRVTAIEAVWLNICRPYLVFSKLSALSVVHILLTDYDARNAGYERKQSVGVPTGTANQMFALRWHAPLALHHYT